jgi:hypothetical protein
MFCKQPKKVVLFCFVNLTDVEHRGILKFDLSPQPERDFVLQHGYSI